MSRIYNNGITTTAGFKFDANLPLDDRLAVETAGDLKSLPCYEGMIVYVKQKKQHATYIDSKWEFLKDPVDQTYDEISENAQSGKAIAEVIRPLSDAEVDSIWNNTVSTSEITTVDKIVDDKLSNINFGTIGQPQNTKFTYYNEDLLVANSKHPIQVDGNYMCYCNNAKLKLCNADGSVIKEGAKQLSMMTARGVDSFDSTRFKACGQVWTGDKNIWSGTLPVDGFRVTINEGAYITADEPFAVCEMVNNKKITKILFIGNSHARDIFMPSIEVFRAEGQFDYVLGLCMKGGASVTTHADSLTNNIENYAYYESHPNIAGEYIEPQYTTIRKALMQHKWDYVFIQGNPLDLTDSTIHTAERQTIATYIKRFLPDAKICYSCSWLAPYSDDKATLQSLTGTEKTWYAANVAKFGDTPEKQYTGICNNIKNNIITDSTYSMVLDTGTAIYYASQILGVSSDVLYEDVLHLKKGLGRVIAGYAFYTQFMQKFGQLETLSTVKLIEYFKANYSLTEADKNTILESVNYALQNPLTVPLVNV